MTDRIKIFVAENEKVAEIIKKNSDSKEWDINGEKISLGVEKI